MTFSTSKNRLISSIERLAIAAAAAVATAQQIKITFSHISFNVFFSFFHLLYVQIFRSIKLTSFAEYDTIGFYYIDRVCVCVREWVSLLRWPNQSLSLSFQIIKWLNENKTHWKHNWTNIKLLKKYFMIFIK